MTQQILDRLATFRSDAKPADFRRIFGRMGEHLWDKFKSLDFDVISFYNSLDGPNRAKFAQALGDNHIKRTTFTEPTCPHCGGPLTSAGEWLACERCGGRYGA